MASIVVALELDIPFNIIQDALEKLEGVQRRFEVKGTVNGITIIDDYGHHPTEIKTTLQTVIQAWPDRRKVEPHRYSRTEALFDEFSL